MKLQFSNTTDLDAVLKVFYHIVDVSMLCFRFENHRGCLNGSSAAASRCNDSNCICLINICTNRPADLPRNFKTEMYPNNA